MDATDMISKLGFPIAITVAVIYGLWKASKWAAVKVVEPTVKAHIELVETLGQANKKTSESIAVTAETLQKLEANTTKNLEEINKKIEKFECKGAA